MLSKRIPTTMKQNAISIEIERLKKNGCPYIDLTTSNPTNCDFVYPKENIIDTINKSELFTYKPNPHGNFSARKAIATYHGNNITANDVVLTASTSEAFSWLFKLLCDPYDEILVISPGYPLFYWLASLENIRIKTIPTIRHERWNIDFQSLEKAITSKTRILVIVNPNNPTGQFILNDEWSTLVSICTKYGITLLVDEVFKDYTLEPENDYLPTVLHKVQHDCAIFVVSGLSKVAALPQIKLSWITAASKPAQAMIESLLFIADQYLSVSAHAELLAPKLLCLAPVIQTEIMQRIRKNLTKIDLSIEKHQHISRLQVGGGWSVLVRRPAITSGETFALRLLKEDRVLVHPGYFFDLPGDSYVVISLLLKPDIFQSGIEKLLMATLQHLSKEYQ